MIPPELRSQSRGQKPRLTLVTFTTFVAISLAACSNETSQPPKENKVEPLLGEPSVAAIEPAAARAAGITTRIAGPAEIRETITLYGTVRANAEREQNLRARYAGTVRSVTKRVGDSVARGETVITVQSSDSLQTYAITSPIAGKVLERHANPGETVNTDTVLIRIANLSTVWVEFAVFARDLGHIRAGMPVHVSASDGDYSTEAKLTYVAPSGDTGSQSVVGRAELNNSEGRWIAGQFVTGDVAVDEHRAAVAVAPAAIQALNGKDVVFVQMPRGFEVRPVTLGRRSSKAIEVLSGLQPGDRYAALNSYVVKADLLKGEGEEE